MEEVMRSIFPAAILLILTAILTMGAAQAGNLSIVGGKPVWQSACAEPSAPPTVGSVGSSADADAVNVRVTAYNDYVQRIQEYMDCVSAESQRDSAATSQSIAADAQDLINAAQARVEAARVGAQQKPGD
jgi:hypothetical protein